MAEGDTSSGADPMLVGQLRDPAVWQAARPCAALGVDTLESYARLTLEPQATREVDTHLAMCPRCRQVLDFIDEVLLTELEP